MIFVIASHNKKKIEELERILSPLGIYAKTPEQLGKESIDVEETGTTFEENALLKAKTICELTGMPAIADDSGLVVDALGGVHGAAGVEVDLEVLGVADIAVEGVEGHLDGGSLREIVEGRGHYFTEI